jgi:Flp pilus assembly protein TadG
VSRLAHLVRLATNESGEALISMALSLSIMLGFTFGIMQVGLAYYSKERISEMAREGARYAILHGATCTSSGGSCTATAAQVQTFVISLGYPNLGGGTLNCITTYPDGDEAPGHRVNVAVTYTFPYKVPFMVNNTLTFTNSSTMYILL